MLTLQRAPVAVDVQRTIRRLCLGPNGILNSDKQLTERKRLRRSRHLLLRVLHSTQKDRMEDPVQHLSLQRQHCPMDWHVLSRRSEVAEVDKTFILQLVKQLRRELERARRKQVIAQQVKCLSLFFYGHWFKR